MQIFVSYARVDKPLCKQIVRTMDVHQVWYDERLHAGQKWWDQISKRLEWCEGFVYLLSPNSVQSEYCRRELEIARSLGKHIFPVVIQARTVLPEILRPYQYIDLSEGLTNDSVKALLDAIYITERDEYYSIPAPARTAAIATAPFLLEETLPDDVASTIAEAAEALEASLYERAVFLLRHTKDSGYTSRFIDIDAMLREAETALNRQNYLREAEREYAPIVALIRRDRTRALGFEAFRAFRHDYPEYDPDNIAALCNIASCYVELEWCEIPEGLVQLERESKLTTSRLPGFLMSKYPITNAQYQAFINAANGYALDQWWNYSPYAWEWHRQHQEPIPFSPGNEDCPRVNICWHEAVAYCLWLSHEVGRDIMLPTEGQWQHAAQGGEGRLYPWGDKFSDSFCNTREGRLNHLTPVNAYPLGASVFGVMDMAGNAWEWCMNTQGSLTERHDFISRAKRSVRGGSFISPANRALTNFTFQLNPRCRYDTIGFRIVCNLY